jgi:hypothetical protein
MGIQSFAGSSSSLPGQTFIDQVYMVYKVRKWARGGSPGFYRATSALGKDGFIYYLQTNGQLVQAPLNGIADVTLPFTEIRILATQYDMISLFKVSAKGTDSLTLTANYTTITSSGLYAFPTNAVGFCDFMAVGAGGGAHHHSGGAGGGGIVMATSIPMPVGQTISAIIGTCPGQSGSGSTSSGGNTTFLGITALGGGGTADNGNGQNGGNGGGAGFSSSQAGTFSGGSAVQSNQTTNDTSQSTYTSTIGNSLSIPLLNQTVTFEAGHGGGSAIGSGHGGGGGGGAGGAGQNCVNPGNPVQGGAGKQITFGPITSYYSAGGGSARHSTQNDGPGGGTHWNNSAGHYGMGGDSEHNSIRPGTSGVLHVRTWSV